MMPPIPPADDLRIRVRNKAHELWAEIRRINTYVTGQSQGNPKWSPGGSKRVADWVVSLAEPVVTGDLQKARLLLRVACYQMVKSRPFARNNKATIATFAACYLESHCSVRLRTESEKDESLIIQEYNSEMEKVLKEAPTIHENAAIQAIRRVLDSFFPG